MSESNVSRREFLGSAVAASAVGSVHFITNPQRVFGANDRVRVAVCGVHGRGMDHVDGFRKVPNVELAALCDVDENVLNDRLAQVEKMGLARPQAYTDVRKLLENKEIDAISIATPNHWHSLIAIWGCQAGKDVYVEKPCSHNLWEGRQLVRAAEKYKRIVQHGTQARSSRAIRDGIQRIHSGEIGEVYMARGLCYKWRDTIGHAPVQPVPPGVHYDLWTGPAPMKPFTRNRFHYNWHWIWDTGNGDIGNQGVHQVDVARWGLGLQYPDRISGIGGHFMFDDDQQTPNTLNCAFEYNLTGAKPKMLVFEVRHWITNHEAGIGAEANDHAAGAPRPKTPTVKAQATAPKLGPNAGRHNTVGDIFYGSNGYMAFGDEDADAYRTWLGRDQEMGPNEHGGGDHFSNFIDCVRNRNADQLNAPIQEGHISAALVHLANASYRLARALRFDAKSEQVIDDEEANRLLRGSYREPYVVPEEV